MSVTPPKIDDIAASIKVAFVKAKNDGATTGANPDVIITNLSNEIASAIQSYITATVVTINPGIVVTGMAGPVPVVGATTSPGSS